MCWEWVEGKGYERGKWVWFDEIGGFLVGNRREKLVSSLEKIIEDNFERVDGLSKEV